MGQGAVAVMPIAEETFWQRFLATYRFRRNFGRERWWHLILGRDPGGLAQLDLNSTTDGGRPCSLGAVAEPVSLSCPTFRPSHPGCPQVSQGFFGCKLRVLLQYPFQQSPLPF